MYLRLDNITKTFGALRAVDEVSLEIGEHEFVCILGPSGCGKTTLLRIVAGLVQADSGSMILAEKDLMRVPARERGFGIVFQSYSLFPNMTVGENIGYGLAIQRKPKPQIAEKVQELLSLIGMEENRDKLPHQLSGGQQQRVALARALAAEPALLLLDEPLSALDAQVRSGLRHEIRDLQRRLKVPTLMVTHDQEEAMVMADRIVCMNAGKIEQIGPPEELYLKPKTPFVANFIGQTNLVNENNEPKLAGAEISLTTKPPKGPLNLLIRPEHIQLKKPGGKAKITNTFEGTVLERVFLGNVTRTKVRVGKTEMTAEEGGKTLWETGKPVSVVLPPEFIICVEAQS